MEIGDKIKVTLTGDCYTTYVGFMKQSYLEWDKWNPGITPEKGSIGTIAYIGNHERSNETLYIVEINNKYYIMGNYGVKNIVNKKA